MPFTPYHFGPSGFVGLIFRKWLDIPVFVLANVIVDIEVLYWDKWPKHRYAHTLLIGAAIGILWGVIAYPLRHIFKKIMLFLRLQYDTSLLKMLISGVLGVWLHIVLDAFYHWDVQMFWPRRITPLYGLISKQQVEAICLACFVLAFIVYAIIVLLSIKKNKLKK
jgi:membrane-bound metal-dependent hydrolase YbcI (DUF457 family)